MKNKIVLVIILVMIMCLLSVVATACTWYKELADIQLSYDNETNIVSWDKVDNALSYNIKIYIGEKIGDDLVFEQSLTDTNIDVVQFENYETITVAVHSVASKGYKNSKNIASITINFDKSNSENNNGNSTIIIGSDNPYSLSGYYYCQDSPKDISVSIAKVKSLSSIYLSSSDYTYSVVDQMLTINKSYFNKFSQGAKIYFKAVLEDDTTHSFYINVVKQQPYYVLINDNNTNTQISPLNNLKVQLKDINNQVVALKVDKKETIKNIAIDGISLTSSDIVYSSSSNFWFSIKYSAISSLESGKHTLSIWTNLGESATEFEVQSNSTTIKTTTDFDIDYPNIIIGWDYKTVPKDKIKEIIVNIDGKDYSNLDAQYSSLFGESNFKSIMSDGSKYQVSFVTATQIYKSTRKSYYNIYDSVAEKYLSQAVANQNAEHLNKDKDGNLIHTFDLWGKSNNFYISNAQEMKDFAYYCVLRYDQLQEVNITKEGVEYNRKLKVYIGYSERGVSVVNLFTNAINTFPEAVSYKVGVESTSSIGEATYFLNIRSTVNPSITSTAQYQEFNHNDTHYTSTPRSSDYDQFGINNITSTAYAGSTTEMVMVMEKGLRPTFTPNSVVANIYNQAKVVLRQIIDDSMNDFAKIHAIYDWLGDNVIYDSAVAEMSKNLTLGTPEYEQLYKYNVFFAEGVFNDGVAVCNGIAQAFTILARIEGIEVYKVVGMSADDKHAWNKVVIDNKVYICDATWANFKANDFSNSSNNKIEYLSHEYLFITTEASGDTKSINGSSVIYGKHYEFEHSPTKKNYAGDYGYNVYANMYIDYEGAFLDFVVDNWQEVLQLFQAVINKNLHNKEDKILLTLYNNTGNPIGATSIAIHFLNISINKIVRGGVSTNVEYFVIEKL